MLFNILRPNQGHIKKKLLKKCTSLDEKAIYQSCQVYFNVK